MKSSRVCKAMDQAGGGGDKAKGITKWFASINKYIAIDIW